MFFPIVGYIRDRGLHLQILKVADYLRQIETEVFGEEKS